jgi:hypothetical protein
MGDALAPAPQRIRHELSGVDDLDDDSAATVSVIRPDTVRAYATDAGFDRIDVLPIENDFWRFYRLLP